jgi:hypothetical protein
LILDADEWFTLFLFFLLILSFLLSLTVIAPTLLLVLFNLIDCLGRSIVNKYVLIWIFAY